MGKRLLVVYVLTVAVAGGIIVYFALNPNAFSRLHFQDRTQNNAYSYPLLTQQLRIQEAPGILRRLLNATVTIDSAVPQHSTELIPAEAQPATPAVLSAFLYNSTPCAQPDKNSTYRIAVRNGTKTPIDSVIIHFVYPEQFTIGHITKQPTAYDAEQLSYFWSLSDPLEPNELAVIDIQGTITAAQELTADVIVNYPGGEHGAVKQIVSERTIPACDV